MSLLGSVDFLVHARNARRHCARFENIHKDLSSLCMPRISLTTGASVRASRNDAKCPSASCIRQKRRANRLRIGRQRDDSVHCGKWQPWQTLVAGTASFRPTGAGARSREDIFLFDTAVKELIWNPNVPIRRPGRTSARFVAARGR